MADKVTENESPWFWKVFGGAIISIITLLLAFFVNSLMINISNNRSEIFTALNALKEENASLREKVAALTQGQVRVNDLIKASDDMNKLSIKTTNEKVQELKDRISKLESKNEPKKENDSGKISQ